MRIDRRGGILGLLLPGVASGVPFQDFQIWTNVTATGALERVDPRLPPGLLYWLEAQGRFGNDATTLSQGILRPGLGYALNRHSSLWVGYAYVPTMEPFTTSDQNEQRLWEQFQWTTDTAFGSFSSRSRLEQRFRSPGSDVGWRFRQKFTLSHPLDAAPGFSLVLSEELFINVNRTAWTNEGFNQNRLFVGFAHRWDEHTKTEIGYMNQFSNRDGAPNELHHILSLAVQINE